jgi:acetolactate decarboxylase
MVALDAEFYQIKADGIAYPVNDDMSTPFACMIFFDADREMPVREGTNYTQFREYL